MNARLRLCVSIISLLCVSCARPASSTGDTPSAHQLTDPSIWLDQAFAAGTEVADDENRRELLSGILRLQAEAGDMESARETLQRLQSERQWKENPEYKLYKWASEIFAQSGRISAALQAAKRAEQLAPAGQERSIASMYVEIVREQAKHGDIAGAKALAEQVNVPEYRQRAIAAVAYQQAETDFDAALETMESASDAGAVNFLGLYRMARDAHRGDLFSRIMRHTMQGARNAPLPSRGRIYRNIATVLDETGHEQLDPLLIQDVRQTILDFVRRLVEFQPLERAQQEALEEAAYALIPLREYDMLRSVLEHVSDHDASVLNAQLAEALAEEGRYDEALTHAGEAMPDHSAFRKVAEAQARRGDFETANKTAALARDEEARNWAYHKIGVFQARGGRFSDAKQTVEQILPVKRPGHVLASADYHRVSVLNAVAQEQVKIGEQAEAWETLEEALALAEKAADEFERIKLTGEIAHEFARAGDFQRARELALEIDDLDLLVQLAEQHLEGDRRQKLEETLSEVRHRMTSDLGKEGHGIMIHARVAALLLKVDRAEQAEQTVRELLKGARSMEPSLYKTLAYAVAAAFYAHADQLETLWQHVSAISEPLDRAFAASAAAAALLDPERWGAVWSGKGDNGS